jgi:hypothetical protein
VRFSTFAIFVLCAISAARADDWLIGGNAQPSHAESNGREITLSNGLISRTWRLEPNAATVRFDNRITGQSMLRGVKPEAELELNGRRFAVGGLAGQPEYAYLRRDWLDRLTAAPGSFRFTRYETGKTTARFAYKGDRPWPPSGGSLTLHFDPPTDGPQGVEIQVHYEMYDGLPLISKWATVHNRSAQPVALDRFTAEILAVVDAESRVEKVPRPPDVLHVETDYAFGGMDSTGSSPAVHWVVDPQYTSQVNYRKESPVMLEVRPELGPAVSIAAGGVWSSFRVFELAYDSTDRERRGLALRRMYRTIAPWSLRNPILMHVRRSEPDAVKLAVDQCTETGFEMVILSFGSGVNMENEDPAYLAQIKSLVDYAHSRGILLGAYSLLASRKISPEDDVINPRTGKPGEAIFGNSPCLGSRWGEEYFRKVRHFLEVTGMDVLEHDGSYPGDVCASKAHPGHRGLEDSQWTQWQRISEFYRWCAGRGIYLNVPDWYFLNGSNKIAMGYREVNWSLPRDRQIILGRQNIYDGTWEKTPSMGWMFVPLVQYHGGGAAATLEPLEEHLEEYGQHLAQNFGSGVQACYRGPRLYDSEKTKAVVKRWVAFYKAHREILDSDIIHVRRADAQDIDMILHVNPALAERGLAMVFNPMDTPVKRTVKLPLYYSGLTEAAQVREQDGPAKTYRLNRAYEIEVPVEIPARGLTWLVLGKS